MITFLGILIFIAGLTALIVAKLDSLKKAPVWITGITRKHASIIITIGIAIIFS